MSRIVPSPDWFVGIDSFDLCVDGGWIDTITIEVSQATRTRLCFSPRQPCSNRLCALWQVDPLDAGTDNGFTFTAPNWPTEPQGVVYRITSSHPQHPAGSFYYPFLKRLPAIATFQFIKVSGSPDSACARCRPSGCSRQTDRPTDHRRKRTPPARWLP